MPATPADLSRPVWMSLGRYALGAAAVGSGVLQLITGELVRLVPKLPDWMPAPAALAYATGAALVVLGGALLFGPLARRAAAVLAVLLLVVFALLYVPSLAQNPFTGFMWTNPLKTLALVGGAALVMGRPRFEPLAAGLLAVFLVVCGLQHFVYAEFVTTLIPSWLKSPKAWTYATGVALICGGTGILVPPTSRLAAAWSSVMIALWVILLHVPRALAGPNHANETAGVFEALALSGVALMVAATRPGMGEARP